MPKKIYRTCVRMSSEEYAMLKQRSKAAGMTMNKYLMRQLRTNRPQGFHEEALEQLAGQLNQAGRIINSIAKDFNSGFGTENQLEEVKAQLLYAIESVHAVREMGYPDV